MQQTNNGYTPHPSHHTPAWGDLLAGLVERRAHKPRRTGITMILDRCQGLQATADLLEMTGDYIDHVKLSFGTSVLLDETFLCRKNELIRGHQCDVYPGGTLTEAMLMQGVYPRYLQQAKVLGFTAIEVSDGTITLPPPVRSDAIKRALDAGFKVISEVGKKDPKIEIPVAKMCEQIIADLALGVDKVIVEARESGANVGIYDANGAIRQDKLAAMLAQLVEYEDDILWEAPLTRQQSQLIVQFGPNVSLGNIKPRDVLGLEALRCGLRFETFRQALPQVADLEEIRA